VRKAVFSEGICKPRTTTTSVARARNLPLNLARPATVYGVIKVSSIVNHLCCSTGAITLSAGSKNAVKSTAMESLGLQSMNFHIGITARAGDKRRMQVIVYLSVDSGWYSAVPAT
jgi:hypothetical protein